jgi:hypothetical protein
MTAAGIAEDQNASLNNWTNIWDDAQYKCEILCELNKEGESCSQYWNNQCTAGELFCDYHDNDTELVDGTCRKCPTDPNRCIEEGFAASVQGQKNCRACTLGCYDAAASKLWIDGELILSQPLDGAIQSAHQNASGHLYDCSILAADPQNTCPGAEGKVCLVNFNNQNIGYWLVPQKAEESGCIGVIAFVEGYEGPKSNGGATLLIPFVYIEREEGISLIQSKIGSNATIQVDVFGAACEPNWGWSTCHRNLPCENEFYCEYESQPIGPDMYSEGYCHFCPWDANGNPDPLACYFDENLFYSISLNGTVDTIQNVESCASSCGAEAALMRTSCKFCPSELTEFQFGIDSEEEKCIFCPQNDLQFPDRTMSLFSENNITCYQMESFFQRLPVPKNSSNCQLAQ